MNKRLRRTFKFLLTGMVLVTVLYISFEYLILVSITQGVMKKYLDLNVSIKRVSIDLKRNALTLKGLKIKNPDSFAARTLAYIPRIDVEVKPKSFTEDGLYFSLIDIHLQKFNIVRNSANIVNLTQIKALTPAETENDEPFIVDRYKMEVENVFYINNMKDEKGQIRQIELNIKEEYKGIKKAKDIARLLAYKIFYSGKLGNTGVNIQKIQKDLALESRNNAPKDPAIEPQNEVQKES